MNQQIKTSLGVIIILITIATFGMFIWQVEKNQSEAAQTISNEQKKVGNSQQQSSIVYTNNEFNFQMTLPKGWENYKVAIIRDSANINSVKIGLPTDNDWKDPDFPKGYASIFSINMEKIVDWNKKCKGFCKSDPGAPLCGNCADNPPEGLIGIKKLGASNKYIYTIDMAQDAPNDFDKYFPCKNCGTGEIYNGMISEISKEFKILDGNQTADWQTYKNDKYGFELKYPREFNLSESNDPLVINPISIDGRTFSGEDFSLTIDPNRKAVPYVGRYAAVGAGAKEFPIVDDEKQYKVNENFLRACLANGYAEYFYKSLMLENKKAVFCVNSFDLKQYPPTAIALSIPRDKNTKFYAEGSCDEKDNQQCLDLFEQILSTLKFTK